MSLLYGLFIPSTKSIRPHNTHNRGNNYAIEFYYIITWGCTLIDCGAFNHNLNLYDH